MLNLIDPPEPAPETHPHLRLVPSGPPVRFRVPEDPRAPWWVRTVAVILGVVISGAIVLSIIFFGSFIKHVYDIMDARQKAAQEQRRAAPRKGPEGSIQILLPEDQGQAGGAEGASGDPGTEGNEGGADTPAGSTEAGMKRPAASGSGTDGQGAPTSEPD